VEKYNSVISSNQNLELVQISVDKSPKAAITWAKKESFPWPTVLIGDRATGFLADIKTNAVPTYVLIDNKGKEILRGHGSDPILKKAKELSDPAS